MENVKYIKSTDVLGTEGECRRFGGCFIGMSE